MHGGHLVPVSVDTLRSSSTPLNHLIWQLDHFNHKAPLSSTHLCSLPINYITNEVGPPWCDFRRKCVMLLMDGSRHLPVNNAAEGGAFVSPDCVWPLPKHPGTSTPCNSVSVCAVWGQGVTTQLSPCHIVCPTIWSTRPGPEDWRQKSSPPRWWWRHPPLDTRPRVGRNRESHTSASPLSSPCLPPWHL